MNREEKRKKAIARRNNYILAHSDSETANYFISLWEKSGIGEVCEDIPETTESFSGKQIFTNSARNKLTEYGNNVALETILSIPEVERTCKFASFDFEELSQTLKKGFATEEQKQNFITKRSAWFVHLKERMKELRISKETLQTFGLDWKSAKTFAYQTI